MFQNWKFIVGVGSVLLTLLPLSAQAGADGRKNTAIVLGAAAAYELLKGKTTEAIALGAGAAYAGKRYEDARKDESARKNGRYYYGSDYNRNTDPYYDSGYGNSNSNNSGYNNNSSYNNTSGYNDNSDYESYSNRSSRYNSGGQYPYRSSNTTQTFQSRRSGKRGWNGNQNSGRGNSGCR